MSDYADRWNAALDRQVVQPQRELREAKKEIERLRTEVEVRSTPCVWTEDDDTGIYYTTCGRALLFECDGLAENEVKFCPFCGHPVMEADDE